MRETINFFLILFPNCRLLLPTVLGMAGDSVANVRFNVAKTILSISKVLPAAAIQVDRGRDQIFFCRI